MLALQHRFNVSLWIKRLSRIFNFLFILAMEGKNQFDQFFSPDYKKLIYIFFSQVHQNQQYLVILYQYYDQDSGNSIIPLFFVISQIEFMYVHFHNLHSQLTNTLAPFAEIYLDDTLCKTNRRCYQSKSVQEIKNTKLKSIGMKLFI